MDQKKVQLLRDPEIVPTHEVIAEALGTSSNNYWTFVDKLREAGIRLN